ncbi:unnamed protein product [Lactuca virosa]|uniref:Nucleotide-binding alpha-beta plait domain-containing protein n=1 Tax=Lactuca virosa TaxID=75947 RepID=A0AAU9LCF8_9ASTR|nr:unnamed protein product [Lactuca virosa]
MAIFFSVKVHFQGVFINKPFCYSDGVHHVFKNINFVDNCCVKSKLSMEGEEGIDLTDFMSPQQSNMEGVTFEGVSQVNGNEDAVEGDPKDDNVPDVEEDNVLDVKGKPMFNEDIL